MIIESNQARGKCDTCQNESVESTHAAVAEGNTGRFCEVLWLCSKCAIEMAGGKEEILTYDQAVDHIYNETNGFPDF